MPLTLKNFLFLCTLNLGKSIYTLVMGVEGKMPVRIAIICEMRDDHDDQVAKLLVVRW
jgi:hypothetical protein